MPSSLTPEQIDEQALTEKVEREGRVKYLQDQLGKLIRERSGSLRRSSSNNRFDESSSAPPEREDEGNPFACSGGASSRGRERMNPSGHEGGRDNFKVNIPEFEG